MKVEEIRDIAQFKRLKPIWDRMLRNSPNDMFYLSHEWLRLWWNHFGQDKEPLILLVWDSDEPIAAAPLFIADEKIFGLRCKTIRWIGGSHALRSDFLLTTRPEESLIAILDHLMDIRGEWDLIRMDDLPIDSITLPLLSKVLGEMRALYDLMPGAFSPYLPIVGSWEEYWRSRSKSLRKNMRSKLNRVSKVYHLCYSCHQGGDDVDWLMEKVFEIESKSWKYKSGTSILSDPKEMELFLNLARLADRKGWLHLSILELDGHPAAYSFDIIYKDVIIGLKASFDQGFAKFSPGKLILYHLINLAFEKRITEVDFGGQAEEYKMQWTDRIREHRNVTIFNPISPFVLLYLKPLLRRVSLFRWAKRKLIGRRKG
jgi:CelD/BcsL family acetyltransferase involved in cellulose biosynthesis